ncbi:hypothetical protein K461DRAFT_319016 [Myriangium duriaei CBS 260.36]|uniref:ASST-domain-containing protein n=1 Tax=Myriangium duriaei CBS 260.36 TaxID=1168546 RepID=A0A9P4MKM5_9PEZI|nr:hypothetical protein K461DRAFT_319016 [Myriangium duriaei CBS 260.36]
MFSGQLLTSVASILSLSSLITADFPPFHNDQATKEGVWGNYTRQAYISNDDVVGPVANIIVPPQQGVSPSRYVTWAPGGPRLPHARPMLLDANTFSTVYAGPDFGDESMSPTIQSCNGTNYLTWWSGHGKEGYKWGRYYMMNNRYEIVYNLTALPPLNSADAHELVITPQCTAILTSYEHIQFDLSMYNITNGWLLDSYFQEIDLATGELLFHWQASAAMPNIAFETPTRPPIFREGLAEGEGHDWFHINSVAKDHKGNYLISSRHACTIYYISGMNGAVIWRLGGSHSDFEDLSGGKATDFAWQHDARWLNHNLTRLSLYDDRTAGPRHRSADPTSRGIILELDYDKKTVRLVESYYATRGIESDREGNMQVLLDSPTQGNVMLGYGQEPALTEFAANGTVLLDVAFGPLHLERDSADNYRALKVNWTGMPYWPPSLAPGPTESFLYDPANETFFVRLHDDFGNAAINDTAYFSWNGATEVKSWVILASNQTGNLTLPDHFLTEVPKTGFEDHAFVGAETRFVAALAINGSDHVLGATFTMEMNSPNRWIGPAGLYSNETAGLTAAWQAYVAKQGKNSLFAKLRAQWHDVKLRPSTPLAAGVSTFALLFLLTLCVVPAWLYVKGRREEQQRIRYSPAPMGEYSFADELRISKHRMEKVFEVGGDDDDDDDDADSERTYFDEPEGEYKGKGSADLATLRSSSSCTVKEEEL